MSEASELAQRGRLGALIVGMRNNRGMTRGELSHRSGVSETTIQRIETTSTAYSGCTIRRLCAAIHQASPIMPQILNELSLLTRIESKVLVDMPPSATAGAGEDDIGGAEADGFGAALRRLREDRGLSQEKLAGLAGVSNFTIRRAEHDAVCPWKKATILQVIRALDGLRAITDAELATVLPGYTLRASDLQDFRDLLQKVELPATTDMTKRDWFAGMAITGWLASRESDLLLAKCGDDPEEAMRQVSNTAYMLADQMVLASMKTGGEA